MRYGLIRKNWELTLNKIGKNEQYGQIGHIQNGCQIDGSICGKHIIGFNPNVTLFMKNWELTMKQLARIGIWPSKIGS